jgi:hypothetical protein
MGVVRPSWTVTVYLAVAYILKAVSKYKKLDNLKVPRHPSFLLKM